MAKSSRKKRATGRKKKPPRRRKSADSHTRRSPAKLEALNPTALSATEMARLLTQAGGVELTETAVREDIEAGAPTNEDGTLNLIHYAAWLVRAVARK